MHPHQTIMQGQQQTEIYHAMPGFPTLKRCDLARIREIMASQTRPGWKPREGTRSLFLSLKKNNITSTLQDRSDVINNSRTRIFLPVLTNIILNRLHSQGFCIEPNVPSHSFRDQILWKQTNMPNTYHPSHHKDTQCMISHSNVTKVSSFT